MSDLVFKNLKAIGKDKILYVAWIGNVDHIAGSRTADIKVLLYPLKSNSIKNFKGNISELEYWDYREATIDVGYLTILRLGQLVKDGRVIGKVDSYLPKKIFNVQFNPNHKFQVLPIEEFYLNITERIINAKDEQGETVKKSVNNKEYNFPLIKFHKSEVICLRNDLEQISEYDLILFPCIETIQFYFCVSDNLSQELFTGGLVHESNTIFSPKYVVPEAKLNEGFAHHIRLRERIPDDDHLVVGRIAYSRDAMRAAMAIYNPIRAGGINKKIDENITINPVCFFPFNGESTISVHGREIEANGPQDEYKGKKIFLVFNILDCTGRFPFEKIFHSRDNDGTEGDSDGQQKSNWSEPSNNNDKDGKDTDDKEPSANSGSSHNKNSKRLSITEVANRFLHKVESEKIKIGKRNDVDGKPIFVPPAVEADEFNTSPETDDESGSGGLDISVEPDEKDSEEEKNIKEEKKAQVIRAKDRYEKHFQEVVKLFIKTGLCDSEPFSEDDLGYIYFEPSRYLTDNPQKFTSKSLSYKWSTGGYLKVSEGKKRWTGCRSAVAVLITEKESKKQFILVDILKTENEEKKPGYPILCLHSSEREHMTLPFLKKVLKACAENGGVSLLNHQMKEFEREYVYHYFDHGEITTHNSIITLFLQKLGFSLPEYERKVKKEKSDVVENKEA